MGKCGERFAYALAKLGAGNLGSCILFVSLMLGKPFPLSVPRDLMPNPGAFHITTVPKGVSSGLSRFLGKRVFLGVYFFQVTLISFLSFCFAAWNVAATRTAIRLQAHFMAHYLP